MKKKLAFVLAVAMCCSFLFGCGSKQDPAGSGSGGGTTTGIVPGSNKSASGSTNKDVYIDM